MAEINTYQKILVETYAEGEYAHITSAEEATSLGDTLFLFLFRELSDTEGCESGDEARRRINRVQIQIDELAHNIYVGT